MTTTATPPSESEVRESVSRVGDDLFTTLRAKSARRPRTRVVWGVAGATLVAGLLGTAGAVAGVFVLPGSPVDIPLGEWASLEGAGSDTLDLGVAPEDSTWLSLRFACTSPGALTFDIGGGDSVSTECTAADVGRESNGVPTFAIEAGSDIQLAVTSTGGASWALDYRFVDRQYTPWAINANGQTYGVPMDGAQPDLQAVGDESGGIAYIYTDTMFEPGEPVGDAAHPDWESYPAYASDGVTVIGEWITGDDGGLFLHD